MAPLLWLVGAGLAALTYKIVTDTPKQTPAPQPQPSPFPGIPMPGIPAPTPSRFKPGQRVKAPFSAVSSMFPPSAITVFQSRGAIGVIIQVTSENNGVVMGNALSTYDPDNDPIMLPVPVTVLVPSSVLSPA